MLYLCEYRLCKLQAGRPKKPKVFPSHKGPLDSADLRFNSPQPDTSRSCNSTDTGLMCRVECLFKFPACAGSNLLLGEQRHTCVNNLPKVEREAPRPGIEPATSRLQVRRPNYYATTPHRQADTWLLFTWSPSRVSTEYKAIIHFCLSTR